MKKVFEGILFDVYHWEQKMFDGSTQTFEKVVKHPSVQIIAVTPEKKIILMNEEQPAREPFISVPGGQKERNETPEETAHKELLEELGMKCDSLEFWKKTQFGKTLEWDTYYFIAKGCKKIQEQMLEPGEKIEAYEVNFEKFLEDVQNPKFRNKSFSDIIFKMQHTKGEIEKFKELLFS